MRHFNEQGFLLDIAHYNWDRIVLTPDVESAWVYFYDGFISIVNRHAPLKKFCVKGRDNPWFSEALSALIRERDVAWAKARQSYLSSDCIYFRQRRNKCTVAIRKAKTDYFIANSTLNANNPKKFWQNIKLITGSKNTSSFSSCINMDSTSISDKEQMLNCFNKHFVASGFLFESQNLTCCDSDFTNAESRLKKD